MSHIVIKFLHLEECNGWTDYFQRLSTESSVSAAKQPITEAKKPENRALNRYRDILPFDNTLVRISGGPYSYINANFVSYLPGNRRYILTQGPLPNTISHFWKMVWQQNSRAIIMLNKLVEKGRPKCSQYFPVEFHSDDETYEGDLSSMLLNDVLMKLVLVREIRFESFIKRQIAVTHIPTGETREISHFNYIDWPDFGEPSTSNHFLQFLGYVRSSDAFQSLNEPPVIHCSAGVGRSGTFVYVDVILSMLSSTSNRNDIDMREILLNLREQRMALVQTPEQLRFSFLTIIEAMGCPIFDDILPSWKNEIIALFANKLNDHPNLSRQYGHTNAMSNQLRAGSFDEDMLAACSTDYDQGCTEESAESEARYVLQKILSHFEEEPSSSYHFYPFDSDDRNTNVCKRFIPIRKDSSFPALCVEVETDMDKCRLLKVRYIENVYDTSDCCGIPVPVPESSNNSLSKRSLVLKDTSQLKVVKYPPNNLNAVHSKDSGRLLSDSMMASSFTPTVCFSEYSNGVFRDKGSLATDSSKSGNSDQSDNFAETTSIKKFCIDETVLENESRSSSDSDFRDKKTFIIPVKITSSKVDIDNSDFLLSDDNSFETGRSSSSESVTSILPIRSSVINNVGNLIICNSSKVLSSSDSIESVDMHTIEPQSTVTHIKVCASDERAINVKCSQSSVEHMSM